MAEGGNWQQSQQQKRQQCCSTCLVAAAADGSSSRRSDVVVFVSRRQPVAVTANGQKGSQNMGVINRFRPLPHHAISSDGDGVQVEWLPRALCLQ